MNLEGLKALKVREKGKVCWWYERGTDKYHLTTDVENYGPTVCGIEVKKRSHVYSVLRDGAYVDLKCRACASYDALYHLVFALLSIPRLVVVNGRLVRPYAR